MDPRDSARWNMHDYPSPLARWNYHPEYEVHLIRESWGQYIVGNGVGTFGPGQLVLVGPYLPHHWISHTQTKETLVGRSVVFQFHGTWLQRCTELLPELDDLGPLLIRSAQGIEFTGSHAIRAADELMAIGMTRGPRRLQHILGMLATLIETPASEYRTLSDEGTPRFDDPYTRDTMNRAIDYIMENLPHEVSMAHAASLVGMSESAFSRYFKHAGNQTFSDMVRQLRIAHACKALTHTTSPIMVVARNAGYTNLSNFNRQFRRGLGMTPSTYRSSHQNRAGSVIDGTVQK